MAIESNRNADANGDLLHSIDVWGKDGSVRMQVGQIRVYVDGAIGPNVVPSRFEFWTASSTGVLTKAMTLDKAQAMQLIGAMTLSGGVVQTTAPHGFRNFAPSTAITGTDTAFANNTLFLSSIFVPVNKTLTGVGFLLGSVGGTDKVIVALYDATGAPVANSTVAASGTTAGTAANTQEIPFTATYAAKGPNMYYVGVAANGATAKLRTVPAFTATELFCGSVAWTHGTVAAVVAPTAFAADKAPIAYVY